MGKVVHQLREQYHVEETILVGDRGMITRLNLDRIETEEYAYIMGVKARQDEIEPMVFEDEHLFDTDAIESRGLKIAERRFSVSDFLAWKIAKYPGTYRGRPPQAGLGAAQRDHRDCGGGRRG